LLKADSEIRETFITCDHKYYHGDVCVSDNKKSSKEVQRVKGIVVIRIIDKKTGKVIKEIKKENIITNNGLALIAQRYNMTDYSPTGYWCLELGIGAGTPDKTDTALWSPIAGTRKMGTRSITDANQVQYYVRYLPEEANGYTYSELGIWEDTGSDLSDGVLVNHLVISPAIEKTSDILVDFYVTIVFS